MLSFRANGFAEVVQVLEGKLNQHQESSIPVGSSNPNDEKVLQLPVDKVSYFHSFIH